MSELTHAMQAQQAAEQEAAAERAAYIRGLVELADLLDANPEIPLPYDGQIRLDMRGLNIFGAAEVLAKLLGSPDRARVDNTHLWLEWHISGLSVVSLASIAVCEERVTEIRVVNGAEVPVTEYVVPERFRPVPADTEAVQA